ncbi:MAG: class I SAM-dependent RNA methyltransferase [Anaerolineae bacterium]
MERVELRLEAMAHGGAALGRDESGRVVFVKGGLPGETVVARVTESRERFAHAWLDALPADPSAARIAAPRCPHFGDWPDRGRHPETACGGCQWQHMTYAAQLEAKRSVLVDALTRIARLDEPTVLDPIGMSQPWRYRNRVTMRVGPDATGESRLGFTALDGATVVGIDECHIALPLVADLMAALDSDLPEGCEVTLRAGAATGDKMIVLDGLTDDLDEVEVGVDASVCLVDDAGGIHVASGRPRLVERLAGRLFEVPPLSFFQVNSEMAEVLVRLVREAMPSDIGLLADVYSGVGVFAICLADLAREVVAIESDPRAVAAAADNAEGIDNLTLLEADAAEGLAFLEASPDVVVLDPPRSGVDRTTMGLLAEMAPHTIAYASCDPATLARDVRQLGASGWQLVSCQPIDMFPQTYHVESVSLLRRRTSTG